MPDILEFLVFPTFFGLNLREIPRTYCRFLVAIQLFFKNFESHGECETKFEQRARILQ